jgi:osmotically inducible protein OsmC
MAAKERSIEQAELERVVREAHERICPYSQASRGNVPVTLEVIGK